MWDLPRPSSISYFWNFGSILGLTLLLQIIRGLFLTFFYRSFHTERFDSVVLIIKEIWSGWLIRFIHINGASIFFFFIYLHMFRGIFYIRFSMGKVWVTGVFMLLILMIIAFIGYVLPWGQISYWAVAVITNLFSVIPNIGDDLVQWIWGGFAVSKPTLMRFYSLHFLMPIILTAIVLLHITFLHHTGSRNPSGVPRDNDKLPFNPYFTSKDTSFLIGSILILITISLLIPMTLADPVNNVPANPLQTPLHIQPEWYFLCFYTILRAIPRKVSGVIAILSSILVLLTLSMNKTKFSLKFSGWRMIMFFIFVSRYVRLTILGAMPAEAPFTEVRILWTLIYFTSLGICNI